MNKILKLDRSRGGSLAAAGVVFALMLVLNVLTPYICDDFTYRLNFLTKEALGSLWEIPESMYAHSYKMNGRLVSHGLAQVFMLLPMLVFDIVNAAVFTLTLYAAARLCAKTRSAVLLGAMFCLMWLFTPSFGQVALWQVGAINYFWSLTGCVAFFAPALLRFREGRDVLRKKWHWAAFCLYSFFFGWYNEIASFVGICMVLCLVVLDVWMNRERLRLFRFLPVVFAGLGYLTMLSMPAQSANKQGAGLTMDVLLVKLQGCTDMLLDFCAPLLGLFGVLFAIALLCRVDGKTLVLSGLFALAGVCANYMPIAASYYPQRCMCTTVLMLVIACGFPAAELGRGKGFRILCCGCAVLLVLTVPSGLRGCRDIVSCHLQNAHREAIIAEAIASGEGDVIANVVIPSTPWSGFYGLADLNTADPTTWPNHSMALYYGIDSIIGE